MYLFSCRYDEKFLKRWKKGMKESVLCQLTTKCHPLYSRIPQQPMK